MAYSWTEKYVDFDSGNDTNSGDLGAPWKTVFGNANSACYKAQPGMRINVKKRASGAYECSDASGNHNDWTASAAVGTATDPIVWRGYESTPGDGGKAKIVPNGTALAGIDFANNAGAWYAMNFDVRGTPALGAPLVTLSAAVPKLMNFILISDNDVFGSSPLYPIRIYKSYLESNNTNPAGRIGRFRGAQIVGCVFKCAVNGIQIGEGNSSIWNSIFYRDAVDNQGNAILYDNEVNVKVVFSNIFHRFESALYYQGSYDAFLSNNIFSYNGYSVYSVSLPAGYIPLVGNARCGGAFFNFTNNIPDSQIDILNSFTDTIDDNAFVDLENYDFRPSAINPDVLNLFEAGFPETIGAEYGPVDSSPSLRTIGPFAGHDWPVDEDVRNGQGFRHTKGSGSLVVPAAGDVRDGIPVDDTTGTLDVPSADDVRSGVPVDDTTGTLAVPVAGDVRDGVPVDDTTGVLDLPAESDVKVGVDYDNETKTGTYNPTIAVERDLTFEDNSDVVTD